MDLDPRQRKLINQAGTILLSERKLTAKELLMVQRQLGSIKSEGEEESDASDGNEEITE